jgi:hypothetical protein
MFELTSSRLPSNWLIAIDLEGGLDLSPEAWLRKGFWEDYFGGYPEAKATYEREREIIEREA